MTNLWSKKKVVSVGNVCADRILAYADRIPDWGTEMFFEKSEDRLGGQAANFAVAMARLGVKTWLVSSVGDDSAGERLLEELRKVRNLNCDFLRREKKSRTGFTISLVRTDGERLFLTWLGHQAKYSLRRQRADVLDMLEEEDLLHVSGYFMLPRIRPEVAGFFQVANAKGALTSLDPGWDPKSFDGAGRSSVYSILRHVDYFEPTEVELLALTGKRTAERAVEEIARGEFRGVIALKEGVRGSRAFKDGRVEARANPLRTNVVDTTGAGDAFDAGFLFGVMNGYSLGNCLRLGNAAASALITGEKRTTAAAFPTSGDLQRWVGRLAEPYSPVQRDKT